MTGLLQRLQELYRDSIRDWRRRRNLRGASARFPAGPHVPPGAPARSASGGSPARATSRALPSGVVVAGILLAAAGVVLIVLHARALAAAQVAVSRGELPALQSMLPGAQFDVPAETGVYYSMHQNGALLVVSGMQAGHPQRINLCEQIRSDGSERLQAIYVGNRFSEVRQMATAGRNMLLAGEGRNMPAVTITGAAGTDYDASPLAVQWRDRTAPATWYGDAPGGTLHRLAWLAWQGGALRMERRASGNCQRGELLVQAFSAPGAPVTAIPSAAATATVAGPAYVSAFPQQSPAQALRLPAGHYAVPAEPREKLEDEQLFEALQAHRLLRLSPSGMAELAPRDLLQWQAAASGERAGDLAAWQGTQSSDSTRALLKRLYQQADGAYLRQQVDIYNAERRLLAWRLRDNSRSSGGTGIDINASTGTLPLATSASMPATAARLFEDLPQGWRPWTRAAGLEPSPQANRITLDIKLSKPADGRETIDMMLAGRLAPGQSIANARASASPACTGRACGGAGDIQLLTLQPAAGATRITLQATALDLSSAARPGDEAYRHLRQRAGQLEWQPIEKSRAVAASQPATLAIQLADRNGTLLWHNGASTQPAASAGLSTMLGLNAEHSSSISGMLARAARASAPAGRIEAALTIDLPLQTLAQALLECQAMRNGRWRDGRCEGGAPAPAARRAGLVVLDADTGAVLAAAGAGPQAGDWAETRDFDRANPARSPLRLPALQHDGGAHNSPGSTFKIISALGLEAAAAKDPQLDALLAGRELNAINAQAARGGYPFRTDAATYPLDTRQAHITNYREQSLERRASDGRLGLPQALAYSLNTWFAWTGELSDQTLLGRPDGGAPCLQALEPGALDAARPILAAARTLGFDQAMRLDGGLLPQGFAWSAYDALQATPSHIDPVQSRHELRQMSIGLRMQATPLQMALASAAIGSGKVSAPYLLQSLAGRAAQPVAAVPLGVRLDRIRAGMKGVVDHGTAAGAFGGPALAGVRPGLYGKTGTAPVAGGDATVWFTGWLEPATLPGQAHRLAFAVYASHSRGTGGEHVAPVIAALLGQMAGGQNAEKTGK